MILSYGSCKPSVGVETLGYLATSTRQLGGKLVAVAFPLVNSADVSSP